MNEALIVVKPLWDGVRWHRPGQTFAPDGVNEAALAEYQAKGFLNTASDVARAGPRAGV
jgi:hypothetical protein